MAILITDSKFEDIITLTKVEQVLFFPEKQLYFRCCSYLMMDPPHYEDFISMRSVSSHSFYEYAFQ